MSFPAHLQKYCSGFQLSDVATLKHEDSESKVDGIIFQPFARHNRNETAAGNLL
jgi:hypothetical protein